MPADSGKLYRAIFDNSQGITSTDTVSLTVVSATSLSATSGPETGGTGVTINGTGFTAGSTVAFGGAAAAGVTFVSATELRAVAPPGTGTVNVRVTTDGATSPAASGNAFAYVIVPPGVASISPSGGSTGGGTPVTITGTDFLSGNTYTAAFGARVVAATYVGPATLTATTPAGTGTVAVTVRNTTTGQDGTGSASYTYATPTVTALSVTSGSAGQARAVTITGTNFTPGATVAINGVAATAVGYVNASQLTATLPAQSAGTYSVRVSTGGVTSAANPPADQYTYIPAPTVTGVGPVSGSTAGGTGVTITGSNLAGASAVTFGGSAATNIVVAANGQSLTATTPSGNAGAVTVAVTTPGGTGQLANGYTYIAFVAPSVTQQPANQTVAVGATAMFSVTVAGTPAPTVQWQRSVNGGAFAPIVNATGTSYTTPATTAADNGNQYRAFVASSQGTATSAAATLTVVQAPTATSQGVAVAFRSSNNRIVLSGSDPNTPARTLTYNLVTGPANGTLSGTAPTLTYTPTPGYAGSDGFTFTTSNGFGTSPPATVGITVGRGTQTIAFTSTPPNGAVVGGATYAVTATASSGLPVVFGSTTTGTCTLSGNIVSFVGNGPCTIAANQGGNATYDPAPTAMQSFAVAAPTITVSPPTDAGATAGTAYSQTYTATGGAGTYTYAVTGTLPPGLTFAAGRLAGTPTAAGTFTYTVTATDSSPSGPYSGSRTYVLTVAAPTIALSPAAGGLPAGTVGVAYSQTARASGGSGPYRYAVTAGALPAGMTLDAATGRFAGTPTQGGTASFTITATDSSTGTGAPFSGSAAYTLNIQAPTITVSPTGLPSATGGAAYSQQLTASGGTAPYTFTTTGPLPAGVSLSSGGLLSGTPTQAGSFNFTVVAIDGSTGSAQPGGAYSGSRSYSLTVAAPTIVVSPPTLPGATVGEAYGQDVTATGGSGSYTYSVATGALPAGVTLTSAGRLAGTPTAGGTFTFTLRATDTSGFAGTQGYVLAVGAPAIAVGPATLPGAVRGVGYSQAVGAAGGTAPYSYAVTAGALPAGLTLSTGGTVAGQPSAVGSYTFTITARDASTGSGPFAGSRTYTLAVTSAAIVLAPETVPAGTTRVAYGQALTATGGTAPYRFAVAAGALPAGYTLATDGTLAGSTATAGSFNFTVTATDAFGNAGSRGYTLVIAAPTIAIAPATLPAATTRVAYSQALTATGGAGSYGYAVTAGALPGGITLSESGELAGTANAAGSFPFTVTATDADGNSGARGYTLIVRSPAIAIAPATIADGAVGAAYAGRITATGGGGSFGYAVSAGALPAGMRLAGDGALSGTPTAGGSFTVTVTATDADGNSGSRAYTLAIAAPTVAIAPATLPAATTRVAYRQSVSASGGVAPYRYAVTAGALPAGLTLAADGTLAGTPTAGGSFTFTVTATDSATGTGPYAGSQAYTLAVAAPTIALSPASLPGGTFDAAYAADLSATGGTTPYAYAVTGGALPGGVTLSGAGRLAGTPTAAGSFGFTVTATDANGNAGAQAYTVAIGQAAQTIGFTAPGARSLSDSPATVTATASSGLPVDFASTTTGICTVAGSSVTLLATGTCTIEARQPGNGNVAAATPVARSFVVTAARLVAAPAQASVSGQVGTALTPIQPVSVAGGTAPFSYALSGGTLPAGLAFAEGTGTLSGTPTGGQAATAYTVTVRDAGGQTASAGFTLAIAAPTLAIAPTSLPDGAFQAAYNQQLTVAGGTQPYRFAVTTGALPAGLALSPTGLVAGTPTAFGRFQLTVTATDSSTGTGPYSAAQAYTLLIAAPAVPTAGDAAATVAYGSADNVVTPTLTGEVTTLAVASPPARGTARVDGRTLVYTPAAGHAGPDSFTYTASNAGGTSAPGTVSVTVSAPTVTITPATLPDARQGDAYSQQLSAAGGTGPYAFSVASGTLPAGLTLSPTGLVAGTPTASGSATFAVRAADSSTGTGPFSAIQGYTLSVALPAAPTVRPVPTVDAVGSSSMASTPTTIVLSDFVSGNVTSIVVVTPPQNGSVTLATGGAQTTATYTPRANFAGTDSFSFAAVGPGGRSPVTSVALSVTGIAPVVRALTATAVQGTPVTVDLTAAATGGPFTAAAVTGVSPAGTVATAIVEGGSAGARSYGLVLTPGLSFSGTATVTYTLSNQFGASVPATVTLSVAARPDPTGDANVNGLSAAQAEATRRFARAQTDNFFRRNEQLHNGGNGTGGRDMGVGFQVAELGGMVSSNVGNGLAPDVNDLAMLKSDHAQGVLGAELSSGAVTMGQRGGMNGLAGLRGRQVLQQGSAAAAGAPGLRGDLGQATGTGEGGDVVGTDAGGRRVGSVGIWSGGAVTVGAWDKDADRAKLTLTTSGLSAGADIKLSDTLIVGAGGGYGADLTRVGGGVARIRGRSWSVAGYGSWAPTDGLFVDGIFGGGSLDFDTRRQVAQTGAVATGSRDGSMLFGSLAAGLDRRGAVDLSAYGRVDWLSASLDRYTESGGGLYGLTYGRRELDSVASVLGLRVGYPQPGWTPRVRGEWRHEFADTDAQGIDYADVANLRYATRGDFWIRDAFTIDVGVEFGLGRGWGATVEVGASGGSGVTAGTARLGVRKEF